MKKIPDKSTVCAYCKRPYRLPCKDDKAAKKCGNYKAKKKSK